MVNRGIHCFKWERQASSLPVLVVISGAFVDLLDGCVIDLAVQKHVSNDRDILELCQKVLIHQEVGEAELVERHEVHLVDTCGADELSILLLLSWLFHFLFEARQGLGLGRLSGLWLLLLNLLDGLVFLFENRDATPKYHTKLLFLGGWRLQVIVGDVIVGLLRGLKLEFELIILTRLHLVVLN